MGNAYCIDSKVMNKSKRGKKGLKGDYCDKMGRCWANFPIGFVMYQEVRNGE